MGLFLCRNHFLQYNISINDALPLLRLVLFHRVDLHLLFHHFSVPYGQANHKNPGGQAQPVAKVLQNRLQLNKNESPSRWHASSLGTHFYFTAAPYFKAMTDFKRAHSTWGPSPFGRFQRAHGGGQAIHLTAFPGGAQAIPKPAKQLSRVQGLAKPACRAALSICKSSS